MIERLQLGSSKSTSAMKESNQYANSTVEKAHQGQSSMDNITLAISEIMDMTAQIASATEEQSMVAEEINRNIFQINDYAKETIEGSKETTKSSQEMQELAENLQTVVKLFIV